MSRTHLTTVVVGLLAAVWAVNGIWCKILQMVPRHEAIVARILGPDFAGPLTQLIGFAELGLAVWVLSRRWVRLNAVIQIGLVATMNMLELALASDLLLWGQFNMVFAGLFIAFVYWYGFRLTSAPELPT